MTLTEPLRAHSKPKEMACRQIRQGLVISLVPRLRSQIHPPRRIGLVFTVGALAGSGEPEHLSPA